MKICIVSDSHDHRGHLAAAVADAKVRGAEAVLHCGDLVAPSTLHAITPLALPIHVIHGNNTGVSFPRPPVRSVTLTLYLPKTGVGCIFTCEYIMSYEYDYGFPPPSGQPH
jgi:predicted phosphodiesterase